MHTLLDIYCRDPWHGEIQVVNFFPPCTVISPLGQAQEEESQEKRAEARSILGPSIHKCSSHFSNNAFADGSLGRFDAQ